MATADTIKQYFVNILQRDPTAAETAYWVATVDSNALTLTQARDAIASGPEATTYVDQIIRIYQAAFGRLPDTTGINGWVDDLRADATALSKVAAGFVNSTEWKNRYGDNTVNDAVLQALYVNVLGRVGSGAEIAAWKATGDSMAQILIKFSNSQEFITKSAAAVMTIKQAAADVATADLATVYNGKDALFDPGSGGNAAIDLTENVEVTNGTALDNTFNAFTKFTQVGQVNTLQSGDVVNGGAGNDTLVAQSIGGTIAATLNSVENLQITSFGATIIEGANATGLKAVSVENSVAATTVRNLKETVDLTVKNVTGANSVVVGYTEAALAGTNVQKLTLDNVTMKAAGGFVQFDDNSGKGTLEQIDITVASASNIAGITDAAGATNVLDGVTKVTVNATGSADLGAIGASKMTSFDASASKAGVSADVTAATGNDLAIKGGEGDDVITFGNATNLNSKDSIDLGAGKNTLKITGTANGSAYDVKNVQTLEVTTDGANQVNAEAFGAGVSEIGFVSANNAHTATVNNLADGATVSAKDATGGAVQTLNTLTINGKNTSGSADKVTVKMFSNDEGTVSTPSTFFLGFLNAAGYEDIKLVSEGKANTENSIATFTAAAQKTITIEGDKKLSIGSTLTATKVDASASTGGVSVVLAGTAVAGGKQAVTGGTGKDSFTIDADVLTKDVTINAGEGSDTLVLTKAAAGNIDLTGVTNAEKLAGLSNFENLAFGGETLLIDDATLNRFTDRSINVVEKGAAATVLNASAVLGSTSKISIDASEMTGGGFTFAIGNSIDSFKGSAQVDTVVIGTSAFLSDADTLNGGTGNNNVLNFDTTGTTKQIVSASQLTNVSNFNTWNIADTAAAANTIELTVSNTVAAQNIKSTNNTLTISAAGNANDTISLDASDVGSAYKLIYTANAVKNTVKLGAGDDVVTLDAGVDTVTLGAGKDTVVFAATAANNTIKDFSFGTASGSGANVDKMNLAAFTLENAAAVLIKKAATEAYAANTNIVVLDAEGYGNATAADAALAAWVASGANTTDVAVLWQDTLGRVNLAIDTDAGNAGGFTNIAQFEGLSITGVAAAIDAGDFILA